MPSTRRLATLAAAALASLVLAAPALGADPLRARQWGLTMVAADEAHATATGAGAVVAVIDTGARGTHRDLAGSRLVLGRDFVDDDNDPQDGNGHGTHVTGIVGATKDNGIGISSVAPRATLLAIRVLDDDGRGSDADVAAGIDYARTHGAHVINLSLGDFVPAHGAVDGDDVIDRAIDRALDAGIVVVAAAGNYGIPICEQPSSEGRLLCVGAVDKRRNRAAYSSGPNHFGVGLGVMAPGGSGLYFANEDILSTWNGGNDDYESLAGTSQAAPHVAGVAALLHERGLRGRQIVQRILATASDAGPPGPDPAYGAGIVNARTAVSSTSSGGSGSAVSVTMPRSARIATVLRRGLPVGCRAAGSGRCTVTATYRGRRVLRGSRRVEAGRKVTVRARATSYGRRLLRRSRKRTLRVRVTLPGSRPVVRRVVLRRR